jgi:hypothetical protein
MDPQIAQGYGSASYVVEKYRPQLDVLLAHGDAIGLHPHAWRWQPDQRVWIADHGNQDWVDECVEQAVSSYRESFRRAPAYHRFGAGFMNTRTMNLLKELGVRIDMTVEPGEPPFRDPHPPETTWTGKTGDFRFTLRSPYRPHSNDYTRPAGESVDNLWELPLSSARPMSHGQMSMLRSRLLHPARSARRLPRKLAGLVGIRHRIAANWGKGSGNRANGHRSLTMWGARPDSPSFWEVAFAAANELEHPYLAFAIRSDTGSDDVLLGRFNAIFNELEKDPRATTLTFVTPQEALAALNCFKSAGAVFDS